MKQKLLTNLFDFEREESVGEIIFYRLFELVVVYLTIRYAWRWGPYLGRLSDVVLPLGIAEYIDITFMFKNNLGIINAVAMTVLVIVGYLRLWRYSYLVTLFLFHLHYVARYSQGEISHGSNIVGIAVLALAVSTLAFKERKQIRRMVLGLCYFFYGLAYTSAALCKLGATGPAWVDGRHLWMWIQERTVDTFSRTGIVDLNGLQQLALDHSFVATAILVFGLLVEFFAFLMWFKRYRAAVITLVLGMHVGILLTMKISFSANVYLLFALAYPWALFIDRGLRRLNSTTFERIRKLSLRLT
ncbi:MAG: hypothetical protein ACE5G0_00870 [Rhodothermales bacterium]